jgi:thiamine kinase-like enzyme
LHARYSAPRAIDYLVVEEKLGEGILFEYIDGVIPESVDDHLKGKILKILHRLHCDSDLAARLPPTKIICREAYLHLYHDRFIGDLDCIRKVYTACISQDRFVWMEKEVARLEALVKNNPAFDLPAASPSHRDPWLNNFLVSRDGAVSVLDWDGLQLSDPMLDIAMAFGPSIKKIQALNIDELPQEYYPFDSAMRSRLELYKQAALLDWIIDPLADYFECAEAGERVSEVRAEKMRIHTAALNEYIKGG